MSERGEPRRSIWIRGSGDSAKGGASPRDHNAASLPKLPADDDAKTAHHIYWLLFAAAAVCVVTLSGPDYHLLAADATLKLPYVGLEASVASFLIFGPIVLIGLWLYMHLTQERKLSAAGDSYAAFPLALPGKSSWLILFATWYLCVPLVMALFAWKAHPRPEGEVLGWVLVATCGLSAALVVWRIRLVHRRKWLWLVPAAVFAVSVCFSPFLWRLLVKHTELRERRVLDLVRAKFEKKDLRDTVLRKAWLDGADLKDAFLQRADLSGAFARHAQLEGASIQGANLARAKLDFAKMRNVWAQPDNTNRSGIKRPTNFFGARLHGATIENASFTEADLTGAEFNQAVIVNTPFREAKMERVTFIGASLSQIDMSEIDSFIDAHFDEANLSAVVFERTSLNNIIFQEARLQGVHFLHTPKFERVSFADASLASLPSPGTASSQISARSRFQQVGMDHVTFEDALLFDVLFIQVTLKNVSFTGAQLIRPVFKVFIASENVRFSRAKICRAEFETDRHPAGERHSRLGGVDFSGAVLQDVGFGSTDLRGAKFDGALLVRVDFSKAGIDKSTSFRNARFDNVVFPKGSDPSEGCSVSERASTRPSSLTRLPACKAEVRPKLEETKRFRTLCDARPEPAPTISAAVIPVSAPAADAGPSSGGRK